MEVKNEVKGLVYLKVRSKILHHEASLHNVKITNVQIIIFNSHAVLFKVEYRSIKAAYNFSRFLTFWPTISSLLRTLKVDLIDLLPDDEVMDYNNVM